MRLILASDARLADARSATARAQGRDASLRPCGIGPCSQPALRSRTLWHRLRYPTFPSDVVDPDSYGNVLNTYRWQAVDHHRTRVTRQWFAVDGVESEALLRLAEQDLHTTVAEDIRPVESAQRGLESGGYRLAPLIINPAGGVNSEHSIAAL